MDKLLKNVLSCMRTKGLLDENEEDVYRFGLECLLLEVVHYLSYIVSGKFEIDISLPPGIGVYSYYGSTSTHYFDICGVSVSPSDDSSISASETIFHLAYTMYHPF